MDGMRKCFEKEFSSIYVFNLRGNQRTSGETSRKEGGKIFGSGSRAPIAITVLVKKPKQEGGKATIYYREVDDYLTREDKLDEVKKVKSVGNSQFTQKVLKPNEAGDWLNQRSELFTQFTVIGDKKGKDTGRTIFTSNYSCGVQSNRDAWVYNFSSCKLESTSKRMVENYNEQVNVYETYHDKEKLSYDTHYIKWTSSLMPQLLKGKYSHYKTNAVVLTQYRPFEKQFLYFDSFFIHRPYLMPKLFPFPTAQNLLLCVSGIGGGKEYSLILSDTITDVQLLQNGQCFPLYWYEEKPMEGEGNLFEEKKDDGPVYVRHDGVTDYIWNLAKEQYHTAAITKEDIFYYVYGLLHSEDYRSEFAADLKKMLPRIPLVEKAADFKAFMEAGRKLADIHLHYETQTPPADVVVDNDSDDYTVVKMKFPDKKDKSVIQYNSHITIRHIPLEAYDYVVNGRSAIEWIMESYRVKTDKASGIVNDPNDWCKEHEDPQYILHLLLSVITVSVKTREIVIELPHLNFKK